MPLPEWWFLGVFWEAEESLVVEAVVAGLVRVGGILTVVRGVAWGVTVGGRVVAVVLGTMEVAEWNGMAEGMVLVGMVEGVVKGSVTGGRRGQAGCP